MVHELDDGNRLPSGQMTSQRPNANQGLPPHTGFLVLGITTYYNDSFWFIVILGFINPWGSTRVIKPPFFFRDLWQRHQNPKDPIWILRWSTCFLCVVDIIGDFARNESWRRRLPRIRCCRTRGVFFLSFPGCVFLSNLVSVCFNIISIWTDYLKLLVPKCAKPQGDWGTKPSYIAPTKRNQSLVLFLFSEAFGGFHIGMYLMYWGNRID